MKNTRSLQSMVFGSDGSIGGISSCESLLTAKLIGQFVCKLANMKVPDIIAGWRIACELH